MKFFRLAMVFFMFVLIFQPAYAGFLEDIGNAIGNIGNAISDWINNFTCSILSFNCPHSSGGNRSGGGITTSGYGTGIVCGDAEIDEGEQCDKSELNGFSCNSFGLEEGNISCSGECRFDLSGCGQPIILSLPPKKLPAATSCESATGVEGKHGENSVPQIIPYWAWSEVYNPCFVNFESYQDSIEKAIQDARSNSFKFCDSTQFMIFLLNRINEMSESEDQSETFYGGFLADGISDDFRKDFKHYFENYAFFETPPFFTSGLSDIITDDRKLVFLPETIEEPGVYEIRVKTDGGNLYVQRTFIAPPAFSSAFYFFPIDGEIGLQTREGEEKPDRLGYGTGFSGDSFKINSVIIDKEIFSDRQNIVVNKFHSFKEINSEKQGHLLELDLEKGTLDVFETIPNLVFLDFGKLPADAKNYGAPFFLADSYTGKIVSQNENLFNWRFLYSNAGCFTSGGIVEQASSTSGLFFPDSVLEEKSCAVSVQSGQEETKIFLQGDFIEVTPDSEDVFGKDLAVIVDSFQLVGPSGSQFSVTLDLFETGEGKLYGTKTLFAGEETDFGGMILETLSIKAIAVSATTGNPSVKIGISTLTETLSYPNAIKEFSGASAVLASIIYSSHEPLALAGSCGTEFISQTSEESPFFEYQSLEVLSFKPAGNKSTDLVFDGLASSFGKTPTKCIFDDPQNKKAVVFWNEKNILEKVPVCENCFCSNPDFATKILETGTKPALIYPEMSVSFWVQFEEIFPVSQPSIKLVIIFPDGREEEQGMVFFDDGQNNDFLLGDGIFGGTIAKGFSELGEYTYYFIAEDIYGNEIKSQTSEFEIFETSNCQIMHLGGSLDEQLNIFIVGDNWNERPEQYIDLTSNYDTFIDSNPVDKHPKSYNIIRSLSIDGLECSELGGAKDNTTWKLIACNSEKVIQSALSCGLTLKQNKAPFQDKVVVLHNGNLRSNADLSGQIARISRPEGSSETVQGMFIQIIPSDLGGTFVHELGHTFGLLDYYLDSVTDALGDNCQNVKETYCIMCSSSLIENGYYCTLTYRDGCNLSIDHADALDPYGICQESQKELNDYEYLDDYFSRFETGDFE